MLLSPAVQIEAVKLEDGQAVRQSGLSPDDVSLVHGEEFVWIDLHIGNSRPQDLLELLVTRLDFHPATVEDCITPSPYHQPKLDEEQNYRFLTFLYFEPAAEADLATRELNLYIGQNYAITVHRHAMSGYLDQFRNLPPTCRITSKSLSCLCHVVDRLIDGYSQILRPLQQRSDDLELAILKAPARRSMSLNPFKRQEHLTEMLLILRSEQSLVMLRRTLSAELRIIERLVGEYDYEGAPEASEEIAIYFRDIADHISKYLEIIESEDKALNHLMEVHHIVSNYRTNEIILVLTVLSAIMLP